MRTSRWNPRASLISLRRSTQIGWRKLAIGIGAPLLSAVLGAALVVWLVGGSDSSPPEVVAVQPSPSPTATTSLPTVTPFPPSEAPIERIIVESIGVDAPVEVRRVQSNGFFPNPSGPEDVAWYDLADYNPAFNGRPGFRGNAVFGGHVDYINYGPAVFWDLNKVEKGDEIKLRLADGTVYVYSVAWNERYPQTEIPWDRWLENNGVDMITLITCGGTWNGRDYSDRRAVRGELVSVIRPPGSPADSAAIQN